MGITALIMAGGKGTRMALHQEKPLLKIGGKPMIEHIYNALKNVKEIDEIVVAVSRHTPKTAIFIKEFPAKVLETPGNGYVSDARYAVRRLKLDIVLTISADLPLLTSKVIKKIIERYRLCNKPALTVVVPMERRERLGLGGEYVLEVGDRRMVPAGINVIDGRGIEQAELDEEIFVIDKEEVTVNVNTLRDLRTAKHLLHQS